MDQLHFFLFWYTLPAIYIQNEEHKWTCYIGVPYGTHLWQVAKSSQMNGNFKIALTTYIMKLLASQKGNTCRFLQSDIVPLVRKWFYQSFAKSDVQNLQLLNGPLNYALLRPS
jgi:hypothetical protein